MWLEQVCIRQLRAGGAGGSQVQVGCRLWRQKQQLLQDGTCGALAARRLWQWGEAGPWMEL